MIKNISSVLSNQSPTHILFKILSICLVIVTASLVWMAVQYRPQPRATISFTGQAEIKKTPTVAQFSFTVEKTFPVASKARKEVTAITENLTNKILSFGVKKENIKTLDYSVYPIYEYEAIVSPKNEYTPPIVNTQKIKAYRVTQSTMIETDNFDTLESLLTFATDNGATSVGSPQFTFSENEKKKIAEEAIAEAIKDARIRAKAQAKALGISLGDIQGFYVQDQSPYPYAAAKLFDNRGESASSVSIEPGQSSINKQVTITYYI
ncbi:MAG: SIMPL domain-containing protein [Alphaproteobacteria bacterium]|nr:SIMPL domain-containing protein [Alphaproteobacteria bacterium]